MSDKTILIVGAGGHAKVLIEALRLSGASLAGILDKDPALAGSSLLGVPVLGDDGELGRYHPGQVLLVNGVGSVGLPVNRRRIYESLKEQGYRFASVLHPAAVVASDVVLEEGSQIMAGAVIQPGCRIGANSIVNTRASVDHDCSIGPHSHLAPGVTLSGGVTTGAGVHIGTGATVIQTISIGENALVAAGAVVINDVAAASAVRGVPARRSA